MHCYLGRSVCVSADRSKLALNSDKAQMYKYVFGSQKAPRARQREQNRRKNNHKTAMKQS